MDDFIFFVSAVLVLVYTGAAIWVICKRQTIGGSIGAAAAAFLGGGLVVISIVETVATFLCWAILISVVLAIIGAVFGG